MSAAATGAHRAQPLGISGEGLRVDYGSFSALHATSLRVAPGERLGIVGESGSGKSTLLRARCGLAPLAAGRVQLLGRDGGHAGHPGLGSKAFRRQVQMVFQDPYGSLHPRQTVDRMLAEPLAIHGLKDADDRIAQALADVGLGPAYRFRYAHQLSGGQRQRVAIARALILQPQVLLLDEPTSALDASVQAELLNLLESLHQRRGLSYVLVSHDLAVVTHLCSRLMVMRQGRVVESLSSCDLAGHRVQADYTRALMAASVGFQRQALSP